MGASLECHGSRLERLGQVASPDQWIREWGQGGVRISRLPQRPGLDRPAVPGRGPATPHVPLPTVSIARTVLQRVLQPTHGRRKHRHLEDSLLRDPGRRRGGQVSLTEVSADPVRGLVEPCDASRSLGQWRRAAPLHGSRSAHAHEPPTVRRRARVDWSNPRSGAGRSITTPVRFGTTSFCNPGRPGESREEYKSRSGPRGRARVHACARQASLAQPAPGVLVTSRQRSHRGGRRAEESLAGRGAFGLRPR